MKNLKLGTGIFGNIYAGKLNKAGDMWLAGKVDVTDMAVRAVIDKLLCTEETIHVTMQGGKKYALMLIESPENEK